MMASHGFTYEAVRNQIEAVFGDARPRFASSDLALTQFSPKAAAAVRVASERAGRRAGLADLLGELLAQQEAVSMGVLQAVASTSGRRRYPFDLSELQEQIRALRQEEEAP